MVHYLGWCKGEGISNEGNKEKRQTWEMFMGPKKKKKMKIENSAAMTGDWQVDKKPQVLPEHPLRAQRTVTAGLQRELTDLHLILVPPFPALLGWYSAASSVSLGLSLRSPWCFGRTVLALWACTSTSLGSTCECEKVLVDATGMHQKIR